MQVLPTWNNTEGGSLAFKFRTNEPTGMMFYNGGDAKNKVPNDHLSPFREFALQLTFFSIFQGDFFAMEMISGYLYLHLDLGSGAIKLRASNRRLDDGAWHRVEILRSQRSGTINVDDELNGFDTPGERLRVLSNAYFMKAVSWRRVS